MKKYKFSIKFYSKGSSYSYDSIKEEYDDKMDIYFAINNTILRVISEHEKMIKAVGTAYDSVTNEKEFTITFER